jgi:hypothetical protein
MSIVMKCKITFEVGLLFRGKLRRYLNNCLYDGIIDNWQEAKGLLDSDFHIWGDKSELIRVKRDLEIQIGN